MTMNEAEKFINKHLNYRPNGYHEWVTPDDALRACEITKQEIIEKTCEFFDSISCCEWVEDIEVKELVKKYKKFMIDGCVWADSHPNWISVEDELPTKRKDPLVISDNVFIHTSGGHYLSAVYDYTDNQWIDVYNIETLESDEVTYWMPIVPPRKED